MKTPMYISDHPGAPLRPVDIEKEYELIQNNKSKLDSLRQRLVKFFHKNPKIGVAEPCEL